MFSLTARLLYSTVDAEDICEDYSDILQSTVTALSKLFLEEENMQVKFRVLERFDLFNLWQIFHELTQREELCRFGTLLLKRMKRNNENSWKVLKQRKCISTAPTVMTLLPKELIFLTVKPVTVRFDA